MKFRLQLVLQANSYDIRLILLLIYNEINIGLLRHGFIKFYISGYKCLFYILDGKNDGTVEGKKYFSW